MKNMMDIMTKALLVLLLLSVTACGGGGGGGGGGATNTAPTANAGADQAVYRDMLVTLDGSASSDTDGDSLTYSWSLTSKPATSAATLSSASIVNPTFSADVDGAYVFSLIVSDGSLSSTADSVTINVTHDQALASLTLVGGSDTIGSLQFDLILPEGFSLQTSAGPLAAGILTDNVSADLVDTYYEPETISLLGQLSVGIVKSSGFTPPAGAFATLTVDLGPTDTLPSAAQFSISGLEVSNGGAPFTGYSIGITVQQQTVSP